MIQYKRSKEYFAQTYIIYIDMNENTCAVIQNKANTLITFKNQMNLKPLR